MQRLFLNLLFLTLLALVFSQHHDEGGGDVNIPNTYAGGPDETKYNALKRRLSAVSGTESDAASIRQSISLEMESATQASGASSAGSRMELGISRGRWRYVSECCSL
jgi:hypothetical protein